MTTIFGQDYAIVDGGDTTGLHNALTNAASAPTIPYTIFLQDGTYELFATQVISGLVRIYGTGVDNTIISQGQTNPSLMAGIMTLNDATSELQLHNLTIKDGIANAPLASAVDGGAILVWEGKLIAHDCKFENNTANNAGGAIYNADGQVEVRRTLFTGNTANSGGAIYDNSSQDYSLSVYDSRFTLNGGGAQGGAISVAQNPNATAIVYNSSFLDDNTATNGGHIYNQGNFFVNAEFNYWLESPLTIDVDIDNALETDPTSPMPLYTPAQKMVIDLGIYGLTAYEEGHPMEGRYWTLDELREVVIGVHYIARAFNLLKYSVASGATEDARALFHSVMDDLLVLRVENGFEIAESDGCNETEDQACTTNDNAAMIFYGDVNITQYTVVHEFGHRFDNSSNKPVDNQARNSLTERFSSGGMVVSDCNAQDVMGESSGEWIRGPRGWGSGPGFSTFQQDDSEETGLTFKEVSEAAADMFLNWVYRRNTDAPPSSNPCTDSISGDWEGFQNINWAASPPASDTTRPGNKRYKYMEDTLTTIFGEHPWSS